MNLNPGLQHFPVIRLCRQITVGPPPKIISMTSVDTDGSLGPRETKLHMPNIDSIYVYKWHFYDTVTRFCFLGCPLFNTVILFCFFVVLSKMTEMLIFLHDLFDSSSVVRVLWFRLLGYGHRSNVWGEFPEGVTYGPSLGWWLCAKGRKTDNLTYPETNSEPRNIFLTF